MQHHSSHCLFGDSLVVYVNDFYFTAIAWSPHHCNLLASGGGANDQCIRFWNTLTEQSVKCVDTGSQVCNLAWSKHSCELVSFADHRGGNFILEVIMLVEVYIHR
jgi:WD40 repeat protein